MIRRFELVATIIPSKSTFRESGPEFIRTVPGDGGKPSKVEEKLNGTVGSVKRVIPVTGGLKSSNPKLLPPNEKLPEAKLEGCPVA